MSIIPSIVRLTRIRVHIIQMSLQLLQGWLILGRDQVDDFLAGRTAVTYHCDPHQTPANNAS